MSPTDPTQLATWNAAQEASRAAYRADRLVEDGWCASCGRRARDEKRRQCWTCRTEGRRGQ